MATFPDRRLQAPADDGFRIDEYRLSRDGSHVPRTPHRLARHTGRIV